MDNSKVDELLQSDEPRRELPESTRRTNPNYADELRGWLYEIDVTQPINVDLDQE